MVFDFKTLLQHVHRSVVRPWESPSVYFRAAKMSIRFQNPDGQFIPFFDGRENRVAQFIFHRSSRINERQNRFTDGALNVSSQIDLSLFDDSIFFGFVIKSDDTKLLSFNFARTIRSHGLQQHFNILSAGAVVLTQHPIEILANIGELLRHVLADERLNRDLAIGILNLF